MVVKNLKLIAKTEEDIKIVSAHLQDSILNVADIANLKKNKIFLMQLNSFMWEDVEKGVFRKNKRIRTVLKFDNVLKVFSKNINQKKKDNFLDFLAINFKFLASTLNSFYSSFTIFQFFFYRLISSIMMINSIYYCSIVSN